MKAALTGTGNGLPFSLKQLARLKPAELASLRAYSGQRYTALTVEQRRRLRDNLYLLLVTISDESYQALVEFGSEPV
jgi:outer membrane lipopolysaccharide assembly protein LptE/RlpB